MSCNPFKAWAHSFKNMYYTSCTVPWQVLHGPVPFGLCDRETLGAKKYSATCQENKDYHLWRMLGLEVTVGDFKLFCYKTYKDMYSFSMWGGFFLHFSMLYPWLVVMPQLKITHIVCIDTLSWRISHHPLQRVAKLQVCSLNATIRNDLNVDNKDTSNGLLVNLTA